MKRKLNVITLIATIVALSASYAARSESIERLHQNYYTQICERFIACGDNAGVAESASFMRIKDVESCLVSLRKRDAAEQWAELLNKKQLRFSPKHQEACFAQIKNLSCERVAKGFAKPAVIDGCQKFIDGTVEIGENCSTQMECKSGDTVCMGSCRKAPLLACGDELCTASQMCDYTAQRCASPKEQGQTCANFSECKSRNCSNSLCGAAAIVSKPGGMCTAGFVCPLGEQCEGENCVPF